MQANQLRPARDFAKKYGVKSIGFGPPGSGKTPLMNTASRPVLCCVEPGLLSMRASTVPTWMADTPALVDEFFNWLFQSKEAANYDTVGVDSISQLSELILTQELARNKDPRQAYGKLSTRVMGICEGLYYMQNKHVYLIAKQAVVDDAGAIMKKPYFPGNDLNIKVPHLYDLIMHIALVNMTGVVGSTLAIRTKASYDIVARDRTGILAEYEPPHLGNLFNKAMG